IAPAPRPRPQARLLSVQGLAAGPWRCSWSPGHEGDLIDLHVGVDVVDNRDRQARAQIRDQLTTADELVPLPSYGRRFSEERTVRLSDTWPNGSIRFDALARYLQDVASDDMADAGQGASMWVVRRTE